MTREQSITLNIALPHDFRIVRYGNSDTLELEIYEEIVTRGTKEGTGEFAWKFYGYYTTISSALKGYIMKFATERLEGDMSLQEVVSCYETIHSKIESIKKSETKF